MKILSDGYSKIRDTGTGRQRAGSGRRSLLITNDFPPIVSGISTYFYQLWRFLPRKSVFILAPKTGGDKEFDRKDTLRVIRKGWPLGESLLAKIFKTLLNAFWVLHYVKTLRVDKLHCGQIVASGPAGWLCKRLLKVPYTIYVYGSETVRFGHSIFLSGLMKKVLASAAQIVPNSDFTLQEYRDFGVSDEKMVKITPGVDTTFFHPEPPRTDLVKKFGMEGCRVLLTVSRLDERKGHDKVIEALPQVLEKWPHLKYIIVGRGREEGRLRGLVDGFGLKRHVIFAGFVPDPELPDCYNLCDIFVLPNRETEDYWRLKGDYEGFGIVFLEAAACGKPVIGGKSGGVTEAVVEGETGLLVDPSSVEEISGAILRLLDNEELAQEMGARGRDRAVAEFDWRLLAKRVYKILTR
ncbi:glycosyltransferase family 4 protein [candidate division KSB1 bacterium]|nr:glycosyltransferase family 4 protein [candidate division KSB1 bacterium]